MRILKAYYYLTKPGIIYGNDIAVIAGFFLASKGVFHPLLFIATLFGISLVIASGCVFNNYIDRGRDEKMERTKRRALVTKKIPGTHALIFGTILGLLGFGILFFYTNLLTTFVAFIGFFFYVVMYSIWKRKSVNGTLVGSISGAVPPVVGYVAVTNHFDMGAFLLFMILVIWQMPHFYAIALFRMKDYAAAGIPVLPVKKGIMTTKIHILVYTSLFLIVAALFTYYGYTGIIYLIATLILSTIWLVIAIRGFQTKDTIRWARQMFFFSLIMLLAVSLLLSINSLLPL